MNNLINIRVSFFRKIIFYSGLIFLSILIISCGKRTRKDFLPSAKGEKGEIILLMDSSKWKGKLGKVIRNIFKEPQQGLPQPEPLYTLRCISPYSFGGLLKHHKNIVLVTTLDNSSYQGRKLQSYFTKESIEEIKRNTKIFMLNQQNLYARGQELMYLFGRDDLTLIKNLEENKKKVQQHFNQIERRRLIHAIKIANNQSISKKIDDEYQINIKIPKGFKIIKNTEDFIWLRHLESAFDKNLILTYQTYHSEKQFDSTYIIHWRNEIMKKYIYGNPKNRESYVITETIEPPKMKVINFKGNYCIETRGLWKTKNISIGGPFISYTFYDTNNKRLYYIEGFISAPGMKKRELIRIMEAILWTLE